MLPTRHGWRYALVLAVLMLAAINYGNGLVYGLTFLLAAVGVVSMLHTHRNVSGLRVFPGPCASVFAGETAQFSLCLANDLGAPRYGVALLQERRELTRLDLGVRETRCVPIPVPARRRGYLNMPPTVVTSGFPLGILYTWSRKLTFPARCLVYPAPASDGAPPDTADGGEGQFRPGAGDDFIGQREYRLGDSMKHINWKAVARGQDWVTKEYGGGGLSRVWLDWELLAPLDTESRLSVLCRLVLDAERDGVSYGIRLPGTLIAPGNGERHRQHCLEALALFTVP